MSYLPVKEHAEELLPYVAAVGGIALLAVLGSALLQKVRGPKPALHKTDFRQFRLQEKTVISHNTAIYRFTLPDADAPLGLPIGQHIQVSAEIEGKTVMRSYTPTSSDLDLGHFDLLVKSYPQGNISRLFSELSIGQAISARGPKGAFQYEPNMVKRMIMVAGGTGITPMLQVIRAILRNPLDRTHIVLLFANVNEEDILLRREIETIRASHPAEFDLVLILNNPPAGWEGEVGFVTKEIIERHATKPSPDTKVLLCGPPPMVKAVSTSFQELGYDKARALSKSEDQVFKF